MNRNTPPVPATLAALKAFQQLPQCLPERQENNVDDDVQKILENFLAIKRSIAHRNQPPKLQAWNSSTRITRDPKDPSNTKVSVLSESPMLEDLGYFLSSVIRKEKLSKPYIQATFSSLAARLERIIGSRGAQHLQMRDLVVLDEGLQAIALRHLNVEKKDKRVPERVYDYAILLRRDINLLRNLLLKLVREQRVLPEAR